MIDYFQNYKFDEVEKDGTDWLKKTLSIANLQPIGAVAVSYQSFTGKSNVTKEILAKCLTESLYITCGFLFDHFNKQDPRYSFFWLSFCYGMLELQRVQ